MGVDRMCKTDTEDEDDDDEEFEDLDDEEYEKLCPMVPLRSEVARKSVCAEQWIASKQWSPPVYPKTDLELKQIKAAVAESFMFAALPPENLEQVLNAFVGPTKLSPGQEVIRQWDEVSDNEPGLFVLESGTLEVFKRELGMEGRGTKVYTYDKTGQSFGELALLHNCPRAATVVAATDAVVWSIDRQTFNHCVKGAATGQHERYQRFLESVEILAGLTQPDRAKIADVLQRQIYQKGEQIIRKGDEGNQFYIIEQGAAYASVGNARVKEYRERDYFGELALIRRQARAADVFADESPTKLLMLDGDSFRRLLGDLEGLLAEKAAMYANVSEEAPQEAMERFKSCRATDDDEDEESEEDEEEARRLELSLAAQASRRKSVAAEKFTKDENWKPPVHPKTPEQRKQIQAAVAESFMFSSLDGKSLEQVTDAFYGPRHLSTGEVVIRQGDVVSGNEPGLFILIAGRLDVFKRKENSEEPPVKVCTYEKPGQSFGELALLYNCPRAATVVASSDAVVWSIDRQTFNQCVKAAAMEQRAKYEKFLESVEILQTLTPVDRCQIADVLQRQTFMAGDTIIRKGEEGKEFYMIEEGSAYAAVDGRRVKEYRATDYFGELALLRSQARAADVIADTSPTTVVVLDGDSFRRLLGSLDTIMSERAKDYSKVVQEKGGDDSEGSVPVAVLQAFKTWDQAGTGQITKGRLLKAFKTLSAGFPEDELTALMDGFGAPANEAAHVDYKAFMNYVWGVRRQIMC